MCVWFIGHSAAWKDDDALLQVYHNIHYIKLIILVNGIISQIKGLKIDVYYINNHFCIILTPHYISK